jgi:hypothetical protein
VNHAKVMLFACLAVVLLVGVCVGSVALASLVVTLEWAAWAPLALLFFVLLTVAVWADVKDAREKNGGGS